jgi:DASS family divalent anion:Na+ symporter
VLKTIEPAVQAKAARDSLAWRWAAVLVPGLLLFFLAPPGLTTSQSRLLAVFLSTIIALVARPIPMGASTLIAMAVLALTRTLPPEQILSGFSNLTVWLIFTAFLFARAVTATGLGARIGYLFIRRFARSPLTLGYSLAAADVALAPFVPSDTARGGGVVFPITLGVAQAFDSHPGPSSRRIGSFLILTAFHATYTASAIFLTGMAANPLIAEFAHNIAKVDLTWIRWFSASVVPGFLSLLIVPCIIYVLCRPEIRDTNPARIFAVRELERMGPLKRSEWSLIVIMILVMTGWVTSPWHGIPNTFVALGGVSAILLSKILTWDELLAEHKAWDALVWFAPLVMMSEALNRAGVIKLFSSKLFGQMQGWHWALVLVVLVLSYVYIHYSFASMTAHITALYPGFLGAALAGGIPPLMAALPLAFFSNLNAGITHYGTGSAPVYFGAGYVSQPAWWRIGLVISMVNIAIWLGVGVWWWKLIGLW